MRRATGLLLAIALAASCSDDEPVNPLPVTKDDTKPPDAGPEPQPDAGKIVRTVEQRNPFGNVAEHENLLWDGDFEWSSPFADQYGWINYPQSQTGAGFDGIRVGLECRSGLKCAAVKKKASIIGIAVSSKTVGLHASFWAKPSSGGCDGVSARLISIYVSDPGVAIPPPDGPDASGWCRFEATTEVQEAKSYFLIENESDGEVLIDDAVLVKAPPTALLPHAAARPPTAAEMATNAEVRAAVRSRRGPHDPPPNAARRAYEAWAKR